MTYEENCPCINVDCKNHKKCDDCRARHYGSTDKPLPYCERPENLEKCKECMNKNK